MSKPPVILISPSVESRGAEFGDQSLSLAETYPRAILAAGGIPLTMPCTTSPVAVAECVRVADGVLLTGGDDVHPGLYANHLPPELRAKIMSPNAERDLRELLLIDEVFRQRKPLLAICRGQQILNVALGGTLVVDIPAQVPAALNHRRHDRKSEVVHDVQLTSDSMLAKITSTQKLGVNSTHHQAVAKVAGPLRVTGWCADGVVEALELRSDESRLLPYLVGVQFHPERLADRYVEHQMIFASFTLACSLHC